MLEEPLQDKLLAYGEDIKKISQEFSKVIVGQEHVLRKMIIALISQGHVLIEGFPGIAKTSIVKTIAKISGCAFSRIQFTPDLLPSDITGVVSYNEIKKFYVIKGPVFANFVLADEINRASPKVQSALLEAMQERQATIGKTSYPLPNPFFVIATQNPIESVGVYNLPEAQIDRFLFKIKMTYPSKEEEEKVLNKNVTIKNFEEYKVEAVVNPQKIIALQNDLDKIYLNPHIQKYIIKIIDATRNPSIYRIKLGKYIEYGSSPRASIGLYMASKANAMVSKKTFVTPQDVKDIAFDTLRHRVILNYDAQSEGVKVEDVIQEILMKVPIP